MRSTWRKGSVCVCVATISRIYLDYVARKLFTLSQKSFDKLKQIHQIFNPNSKSITTKFSSFERMDTFRGVYSYFGYSGEWMIHQTTNPFIIVNFYFPVTFEIISTQMNLYISLFCSSSFNVHLPCFPYQTKKFW